MAGGAADQFSPGLRDLLLVLADGVQHGKSLEEFLVFRGFPDLKAVKVWPRRSMWAVRTSSSWANVNGVRQVGHATGMAERIPDEVIGLHAGLLQAGGSRRTRLLWPVEDQSTAVLMTEFYRLLAIQDHDPATALDLARRHMRDATAASLAEWFQQRHDSQGTDLPALRAAADLRSRHDSADRPYLHSMYWAGFVYAGP